MRGVAKIVPPSAIDRRLGRLRPERAEVIEAKAAAKRGDYREAIKLLIKAGHAEPGHLEGYDRWAFNNAQMDIEDFV